MRSVAFAVLLLSACACAHGGEPPAFAPNQVWRMKDPPSPGARVVVDAVETFEGRTVVRYSVFQFGAALVEEELLHAVDDQHGGAAAATAPTQQSVSSMFLEDGRWEPGAGVIRIAGWGPTGWSEQATSQITNLSTYDTALRNELARRPEPPEALQEVFPDPRRRMSLMFPILPEEREIVLAKPLSEILDEIAAWRRGGGWAEPPPPPRPPEPSPSELPGADETPTEDAALDSACREGLAPPPESVLRLENARRDLDARRATFGLPPMPDVPDFEPAYSNVRITSSPEWGVVWRADLAWGSESPRSRMQCWRRNPDEPPHVRVEARFSSQSSP
jgi:hypothetical protein